MDKKGAGIRQLAFTKNPCFLLTDHIPMPKKSFSSLKRLGARKISLGPKMLFASQCIVLIHNQLDILEKVKSVRPLTAQIESISLGLLAPGFVFTRPIAVAINLVPDRVSHHHAFAIPLPLCSCYRPLEPCFCPNDANGMRQLCPVSLQSAHHH